MASRMKKAVRLTAIWLMVPAAFGAVGYYLIGPRLGSNPVEKVGTAVPNSADGPSEESDEPEGSGRSFTPPKIEVSVKKGSTVSQRDLQRPRPRRKPTPKPAEPAVTPAEPPVSPPTDTTGGGETVPVGDGL